MHHRLLLAAKDVVFFSWVTGPKSVSVKTTLEFLVPTLSQLPH